MIFSGKNIIVISQQDWGPMFLSKHHYAIALASLGNNVYFINSPDTSQKLGAGEIQIAESGYPGLKIVSHRLFYPYNLKFRAKKLADRLMKLHVNRMLTKIQQPVHCVWSFDISNTMPLKLFPESMFHIFFAADEPGAESAGDATRSADLILTVSKEFLDLFPDKSIPAFAIGHGVTELFLSDKPSIFKNESPQVGLSGNFLRPDIDREVLFRIIEENPGVIFNLYGTVDASQSNLVSRHGHDAEEFVQALRTKPNVLIHGQVGFRELAGELKKQDMFLICYDPAKDFCRGTNYHKVLEYMATGKVIVSNNITTYADKTGLVEMPCGHDNIGLAELFSKVISGLDHYNSAEMQERRIEYARSHTYTNNVKHIESFIEQHCKKREVA